jgi:hypothetical protein
MSRHARAQESPLHPVCVAAVCVHSGLGSVACRHTPAGRLAPTPRLPSLLQLSSQTLYMLQLLPTGRFLFLQAVGQHCRVSSTCLPVTCLPACLPACSSCALRSAVEAVACKPSGRVHSAHIGTSTLDVACCRCTAGRRCAGHCSAGGAGEALPPAAGAAAQRPAAACGT